MANTNITYRAVKGSALTFSEMDQNFASFFYSASAYQDTNGFNRLRLHYTGSSLITGDFDNDRYLDVLLPDAQGGISGAEVGGSDTQIQFNDGGNLAGDPEFLFDKTTNRVSIGLNTLDSTLTLRGTTSTAGTVVKLNSSNTNNNRSQSYIDISKGNSTRLKVGLTSNGSAARPTIQASAAETGFAGGLEIGQGSKTHLRLDTNGTTIGVANLADLAVPNKTLTVIGQMGIGNGATTSTQSTFLTLADGSFTGALTNYLPTNAGTSGLLITTPYSSTTGGNIVVGINKASGANETFSVFSGANNSFNKAVATFKADGKIGFNQRNPLEILHVEGNITGSGNIQVEGTATVKTIAELSALNTEYDSSTEEYARTLVKSSTGLVQYMDAAPIPKGGIIMWAGSIDNIPIGWRLCDGSDENGIAVPDLRERFIVGAGGSGNANTTVTGTAYNIGTIGGNNYNKTLAQNNIPRFNCNTGYQNTNFPTNARVACGTLGQSGGTQAATGFEEGRGNPDWSTKIVTNCVHRHSFSFGNEDPEPIDVRPPYYALAFIIYVGANQYA